MSGSTRRPWLSSHWSDCSSSFSIGQAAKNSAPILRPVTS
jgi:hypothetical protein